MISMSTFVGLLKEVFMTLLLIVKELHGYLTGAHVGKRRLLFGAHKEDIGFPHGSG